MNDYVVAIVVALIAAGPGLYALIVQRKKDTADVAEKYQVIASKAATEYIMLQERVKALEAEVIKLEAILDQKETEIQELQAGVLSLRQQIADAGMRPAWQHRKKDTGKQE